jgi:thiamine pyrophosphate-dependent acetolactate synthase large subunit-like protein
LVGWLVGWLFSICVVQDAHEFLNYLLNELADEVDKDTQQNQRQQKPKPKPKPKRQQKSVPPPPSSFVRTLFEGRVTNETK